MDRPDLLLFAAAVTCAVAAGCANVAATSPAAGAMDLGGGLTMTADGTIRGALPMWPTPAHVDDEPAQASAQR